MLRITAMGASAKGYYTRSREADYYLGRGEAQEGVGLWWGALAEQLGLRGEVGQGEFDALIDNIDPRTGETLTCRTRGNRRSCYDFTFDMPKSCSIVHHMLKDERIKDAFDSAVFETLAEIQEHVRTRVRKGGVDSDRPTGNLVAACFDHMTARPVDGGVPDPHYHKHVVVANVTRDPVENRLKAICINDVKIDAPYFQEAYHSRFASKLREAGFMTTRTEKGFELAGVGRDLVMRFSGRTKQVEAAARELGIDDPDAKARLGAKTRGAKAKDMTMSELRAAWDARLTPEERSSFGTIARGEAKSDIPDVSATRAVDHAIESSFARASVTTLPRLAAEALRHGVGSASFDQVMAEIRSRPDILTMPDGARSLCTTREVMGEEQSMIEFARSGRGACDPLVGPSQPILDRRLSEEQRAACRAVWSSTDAVILIRGGAGTGKTTMMREIVRGIEAEGGRVFACAPSAQASRGVQRDEGFAQADTLARLLQDATLQASLRGAVIWLDEAGLSGVRQLNELFRLAAAIDCRVICSGDSRQHSPVDRGDALVILEENSGCKPSCITQVRRQKNAEYRAAVVDLSEGRTDAGLDRLDRLGFIVEAGEDRHRLLAAEYLKAIDEKRSVLCVAPTWAEVDAVTAEVRSGLKERGLLKGQERPFVSLKNDHSTVADLKDPVTYKEGQVVQFVKHAPGLKKAEKLVVAGVVDGEVIVRRANGETLPLPLRYAERFSRYQPRTIGLCVGEEIRITQNSADRSGHRRLDNGSTYEIAGFEKDGAIRLANGWTLPPDFGHATFAVASTSHGAQGRTVDRVIIAQGSESLPASSREQIYVSCSRGREAVKIFTDDLAELKRAVSRSGLRTSATEVFGRSDPAHSHAVLNARLRAHAEAAVDRAIEAARERHREAPPAGAHPAQTKEFEYER